MEPILDSSAIRAAARTPLGTLSLMAWLLAVVAIVFFRDSADAIRLAVFLLMFAGVLGFGIAVARSINVSR